MDTFPVYFLQLGDDLHVIVPEDRQDLGHTEFWEQTASHLVAQHYGIPQEPLANLPYCQRRGRVVGNTLYVGTRRPDPKLVKAVREAMGNDPLTFAHDAHERRLREDVRQFRRLVRRASRSG